MFKTYVKSPPGAIGQEETEGTPSIHGVPFCVKPWKWMPVPSSGPTMRLCTVTSIVSPQFASTSGPGNCPLTRSMFFWKPSGESDCLVMVQSYLTVLPVFGVFAGFELYAVVSFHGQPSPCQFIRKISVRFKLCARTWST